MQAIVASRPESSRPTRKCSTYEWCLCDLNQCTVAVKRSLHACKQRTRDLIVRLDDRRAAELLCSLLLLAGLVRCWNRATAVVS